MKVTPENVRRQLLFRRTALLGFYGRTESADRAHRAPREPDWVDQAQEEETARVLGYLSDRERREIKQIDEALKRIESGEYGTCAECGGAIEERRLVVVPEAVRCLECSGKLH